MAIIYSYPEIGSVHNDDLFIISRTSSDNKTFSLKATELSNYILGGFSIGIAGNSGTGTIANGETLSIIGANNEILTTASGQDITVSIDPKSVVTYSLSGQVSLVDDYKIVLNDSSTLTPTEVVLEAGTGITLLDQGNNTVQIQSISDVTVAANAAVNTLPIFYPATNTLGNSPISISRDAGNNPSTVTLSTTSGQAAKWFFNGAGTKFTMYNTAGNDIFLLSGDNTGYYTYNFQMRGSLAVGRSQQSTAVTLDVGAPSDTRPAAWFRNGVVISNNPPGVQVDNTSMVIGAGNNDNISGSDHCLIVGSGNQITVSSSQSVAFGQGNAITNSNDAFAVGNSNTLSSSRRTQALGYNNQIQASSSFIAGGDNNISTSNSNIMVLGYDNSLPSGNNASAVYIIGGNNQPFGSAVLRESFGIGNNLTLSQNVMTLGYRNNASGYPTPDKNLGLGDTKFVVGVGSSTITNANALIITEGGVNGGSQGSTPQIPRVILPSVVGFNFADDTAAAAGGIPVGGLYHNAGVLRIRLT